MDRLEGLLQVIHTWQNATFPQANSLSKLAHLIEEIVECKDAILQGDPDMIKEEYADCFLLLFGSAMSQGLSYDDIVKAMLDKMIINQSRQWGQPDENGVVKHIQDA